MKYFLSTLLFAIALHASAQVHLGVEESIKLHMMPLYVYSGKWNVTLKDISNKKNTIIVHGEAYAEVRRDSIRFKRDSAEINFQFEWGSQFIQEFIDIKSLRIAYVWDNEGYLFSVDHQPRCGIHSGDGCFPTMNLDKMEMHFDALTEPDKLIYFFHAKIFDDKIIIELKQQDRMRGNKRHRVITFDRSN